ncbi:U3 small nucleolar RNA-associated protein 6 homolog [Chrysoperla carnea]|uniref:U3 small nucleolar RNA-associated protein 6 homolog n=1 Tax=Chrysoperla carnea TaxID=189513 RepID=UPI001D074F64|nr:U3 small nucleolar RNA-associated protein 6 homolog [Chrysoperla carnea]
MAEYVKQRLENITPELEELKRLNLYNDDEIRKQISKRSDFEYKLQRHDTEKHHFLSYIEFEINLLEDIHLRRLKHCVAGKKSDIEQSITNRIIKLYEQSITKFTNDISLWLSLISFGTQAGRLEKVSEINKKMMETHPRNPEVWTAAALWHVKQGQLRDAEQILLKALQYNPECENLYIEAFTVQLKLKTKIKIENSKPFEPALIIFRSTLKYLPKIELLCNLLNMTDEYDESGRLQFEIINILEAKFSQNEYFWHALALRALEGKPYDSRYVVPIDKELSVKKRLENACAVYVNAVSQIETPRMWEYYLNTILNYPHTNEVVQYNLLQCTYERCRVTNSRFLTEHHYLMLIQLTDKLTDKEHIIKYGIEQYPESCQLWTELLCFYVKDGKNSEIDITFKKGVEALKDKALPLWKIVIKYYMIPNNDDREEKFQKIKKFYLDGISVPFEEVSNPLKIDYIEWLIIEKSFSFARTTFLEMLRSEKQPLELIRKMISLESSHIRPNYKIIKHLLEIVCNLYGDVDIDSWINLIKFQMKHNPAQVSFTCENAKLKLLPEYRNDFQLRYQILRISDDD